MRITVLGATGGTGRHVVDQALNAGHRVTALVRDPARLPVTHERLETVRMPVPEPDRLRSLLSATDAVVSALAASAKGGFPATTWTGAVLSALEDDRATRLAVVSASPVGPKEPGGPLPQRLLMPLIGRLFRDAYLDLGRMEAALEASGAAWTVVRPPQLTDAPATGEYRLVLDRNVPSGYRISRADLAHALLRVLDDPATVRRAVGVAD
ncbi:MULTISPECIES: NAD(P)-dependent oxidoreductase [Nocardiopsis]|uniref:NAD(P)-dependent oxidoreductase n=1 Tax=Nocardiopsis TaxID=2013 RepID=UPI00035D8987|nr:MULTISPECIES: NAD(P)H-binding protein [Nocardiopsis]ASU58644.1 NmrA family protein [Nocardiopsis dassonvillei]